MGFPVGNISVRDASYVDETSGRNWVMRQATDVRFLAVRGTIIIGDVELYYQFTLVKYHLNDALTKEFDPDFFFTLNCGRKERWGFQDVAWLEGTKEYDVDAPYIDTWLSIFDTYGNTCGEVRPFVYNYNHLRVHRHGAAVFAEEKKLIYLLPLIVEAHHLLPATPIFWERDDKTVSLYRTSMWLHEETIQWLATTGEQYPVALRSDIQPRLDAIRNRQQGRRQPPTPPQPTRWQERNKESRGDQASHEPAPPRIQAIKLSPRHMVDNEKTYMELQKEFLEIAQTVPQPNKPLSQPARVSQPAAEAEKPRSSKQKAPEGSSKPPKKSSKEPAKIEAGAVAAQRPAPPMPTTVPSSRTDAPGTGEPSTLSPDHEAQQAQPQAPESSSSDSPYTSSSSSGEPDEVVQSSPEHTHESRSRKAIDEADVPTLRILQKEAEDRINVLASELTVARGDLKYITKRLKTANTNESRDVDMEKVD